jgi:diguanylate cyclase (GGDEF)-like protein
VLFIDLDDFKTVNDSLGHAAGDELLVGVGQRLDNALRERDVVARFGGDEFAVLLLNGGTAEQSAGVAKRLLGVLRAPFALGAGMASGQGSGGLVVDVRDPDMTVDDQAGNLMRQADLAMYAAKAAGGGACIEFRDELQDAVLERVELQGEITQALIRDDFTVHYQPVVDLPTARVVAVEALLRWQHPERGDIPPSVFVPIAERSGAIVALGLWVLERACLDLRSWDELCPGNELRITVNVSARQLRDTAVGPQIARVLHRTKVDPRRLVLEVTESLLMDDDEAAAATLWQLRGLGIRIAVDDFGTGYSSLSRLVDLPLDDLKIDRTFISELGRSDAGATIINAAVAMAHGLDLNVVAEGVENTEQLEFLQQAGCDQAQGFLFSAPIPAEAVVGMLKCGAGVAERMRMPGPQAGGTGPLPARPSPTIIPPLPRHR